MAAFIIPGKQKLIIDHDTIITAVADRRGCDFYVLTKENKEGYKRIDSSQNLGYYKKQLADSLLFDVHKKYLVNLKQVKSYGTDYVLEFYTYIGIAVKVAKRKRKVFNEKLKNSR